MTHRLPLLFLTFALLLLGQATAQTATTTVRADVSSTNQNTAASLASLPEADTLIYLNPRRILNDAVPRVVPAKDVANMRTTFESLKKDIGVDPANLDYVVIALRFHKPAADLSFVPPEVIAVVSGDLSADSLMTMAQLAMQEKTREETHGARKIAIAKIDPIVAAAEKNPLLKSFSEIGFAPLNTNTVVVGNVAYLKAALDAADGTGRITNTAVASLIRNPDALISVAGSPIAAFARSFGLLGTEANARDPRCETSFGNFYAAVTMEGNSFNVRGAMNADNPDTAKIIHGLFSSLFQQAVSAVPDKDVQNILSGLKLMAQESEVVISASIPEAKVAEILREQSQPKTISAPATTPTKKRVVRKKPRLVKRT
ncbi:MAG TPA: hypothetical protein VLA93_13015 [Pyrinomonadaceae bacterium]|nr:hypothetical protein [Pyrinomonadaceae bacterium]